MNKFDRDRNGQIDANEQAEMSSELGGDGNAEVSHGHKHGRRHGHHGRRGMGHKKLKRLKFIYDVDSSGDLSDEERAVLGADLVIRCENKQAYLLENFDADGSGDLSEEELQAASDARQAERGSPRGQAGGDGHRR